MDLGCLFEVEIVGGLGPQASEFVDETLAAGGEKGVDGGGLLRVALVGAALEAGCEALLHLGVDAAGKARIGMEVFVAAAQIEEVEHAFEEGFGGDAGREGSEEIGGGGFCNAIGYIYAGISVVHRHAQKGRRLEMEALARAFSEGCE